MKSLVTAAVLLFASVAIYAQPAKPCEELKSEIARKMEAKGVTSYSLEIAATDKAKDTEGKVVGSCDGGSKKTHREGSAAPVVVVNEPIYLDAGTSGATTDEVEPNDSDDVATRLVGCAPHLDDRVTRR